MCQARGHELSLADLVHAGLDCLPAPGSGQTLARWQRLAAVAAHDLALVKLFEGHTDALAIQAELGSAPPPLGSLWGTWCAEPPQARLQLVANGGQVCRLQGTKAWCSGADTVSHAVVSGWNEAGEPCLATVALHAPGVTVTDEGWAAVGMASTRSVDVHFDGALGHWLGRPGDYVKRAGFWQGGAGIAACWWGGAAGIAEMATLRMRGRDDAHGLAHLGTMDVALSSTAALLRECAAWVDAHPQASAQAWALRVRLAVEQAADVVMRSAGRALGAGPLCRDARFAQAMADLPVFLRQSHAERDLAALGAQVNAPQGPESAAPAWRL
ncbi:MAG: acyl-CoA dehydrogenase [Comamonadaceae bacterium]|nr:MAG: acyl-CoA dehydrogenase [Comamonadaceae bacterium]